MTTKHMVKELMQLTLCPTAPGCHPWAGWARAEWSSHHLSTEMLLLDLAPSFLRNGTLLGDLEELVALSELRHVGIDGMLGKQEVQHLVGSEEALELHLVDSVA